MPKKQKFKPVITRIKLNPEQAVLGCMCYTGTVFFSGKSSGATGYMCYADRAFKLTACVSGGGSGANS